MACRPIWRSGRDSLRIVCEQGTADQAEAAIKALQEYTFGSGRWEQVEWTSDQYLGAVRKEFGLKEIKLMGDAPAAVSEEPIPAA